MARKVFKLFLGWLFFTLAFFNAPAAYAACDPAKPGECPAGLLQIEALFRQILSVAVAGAVIALVLMLIYGGIRFLVSGGEAKNIKPASETITWALLGMVFLVIAWLLLLLIRAFTGVNLVEFNIGVLCTQVDLGKCI